MTQNVALRAKKAIQSKLDFDQITEYLNEDTRRITMFEAMYLRKGDVVLVRSSNVPQLGDHYIVVTGPVVEKPHGMRPQTISIPAPNNVLLDRVDPNHDEPVVALQLSREMAAEFLRYHKIEVIDGEVLLPMSLM